MLSTRWVGSLAVGVPLVLSLAVASSAQAQDDRWTPRLGPSLTVSIGAVPAADARESGQRFGYTDLAFGVGAPIKGGWQWDDDGLSGFRLVVHGGVRFDSASLPFATDRRTLVAVEGGVAGLHVLSRGNQILWSVGTGFAEDSETMSSPSPRVVGRVMGVRRTSEHLTLVYGGAYSYVTGRPRLLPLFGVVWRPSADTTVSAIGPVSGRVTHRLRPSIVVGGEVGLRGNQYRVTNDHGLAVAADSLRLRVREVRAGAELGAIVGTKLALVVEAGMAAGRRLTFTDGSTELLALDVGAAPYASIRLRYGFSRKAGGFDW